MRSTVLKRPARRRVWLVLAALAFRAAIPQGFMPSTDALFALQLCPEGLPAAVLAAFPADPGAHHHDHHASIADAAAAHPGSPASQEGHTHPSGAGEHCAFAAAAGHFGPAASGVIATFTDPARLVVPPPETRVRVAIRRHRLQQPRAPPAFS